MDWLCEKVENKEVYNEFLCLALKRSIYSNGKSFKGNVESSNPCYSFHYTRTSNRL